LLYESWKNDICSFRATTVALTLNFKLVSFLTFIYTVSTIFLVNGDVCIRYWYQSSFDEVTPENRRNPGFVKTVYMSC